MTTVHGSRHRYMDDHPGRRASSHPLRRPNHASWVVVVIVLLIQHYGSVAASVHFGH